MVPGIYKGMSQEEYLKIQGLSKTSATKLLASKAHYKALLDGGFKETDAMEFGTDIDNALFYPDKPLAEYPKATKKDENRRNALHGMLAVIDECKTASFLISGGDAQVSLLWEYDGVQMRSRPDYVREDVRIMTDYKTAANGRWEKWKWQARDLGYDVQAAIAIDGMFALTGDIYYFVFIVQEKSPPYFLNIYEAPAEMVDDGRAKYMAAAPLFREFIKTKAAPAYIDEVQEGLYW